MSKMAIKTSIDTRYIDNAKDRISEGIKRGRSPIEDAQFGPMLKASPAFFATVMLRGPNKPPYNGNFLTGPHHVEWDNIVRNQMRFSVLAARGLGKSTYFSLAVPLWHAVCRPSWTGLLIGSQDDNAKRVLLLIREEIEGNPLLQWLYPAKNRAVWSTRQVRLSNGHRIHSRSIGSRLRGLHPDYTYGDDVLTEEAKYSETYRRKTADYWHSVIGNLPMAGCQLGIVGTPLAQNDLMYGDLRRNPEYHHSSFPVMDEHGHSTWPEHIPDTEVARKKREMGSIRFDTEMRCLPVSDETSLFPRSLFAAKGQFNHLSIMPFPPATIAKLGMRVYIGVDFAFSASVSADYFVVFVLGVDGDGNRHWLHVHRDKGVPFEAQLTVMKDIGHRYNPDMMFLESNAAQQIMGDEMIRTSSLPIKKFVTTTAKHSFDGGLYRLRLLAENGKWRIPRGDAASQAITDTVLGELGGFTFYQGKAISVGEHDDTVFALWLAERAASAGEGYQMYFGEADDVPVESTPAPLPATSDVSHQQMTEPAVASPQSPTDSSFVAQSVADVLAKLGGI